MTFFLSKFLWYIFSPFNLIIFLFVIGVILNFINFKKFSKILFFFTFLLFFITGVLPTGSYLMYLLEKDFHSKIYLPDNIDGILVLAGATNPYLTKEYNQISLNDSVERLTESIQLIKKYPRAKVFFAGGSGSLTHPDLNHSAVAKIFYESLDVDINKIYFENKSRNTYENILFAKKKFNPNKNEKWILITSAFHLTRAINIGKKLNWELIPYATDFKLPKKFTWKLSMSFFNNLSKFQQSSHEWAGLIAYYFLGRSSKIL